MPATSRVVHPRVTVPTRASRTSRPPNDRPLSVKCGIDGPRRPPCGILGKRIQCILGTTENDSTQAGTTLALRRLTALAVRFSFGQPRSLGRSDQDSLAHTTWLLVCVCCNGGVNSPDQQYRGPHDPGVIGPEDTVIIVALNGCYSKSVISVQQAAASGRSSE